MRMSSSHRASWIWLFVAVLLFGRVEGAHLHLCFDGLEPPAAVHVADGVGHDDGHHLDAEHVDQDVDLYAATLIKKSDGGLELPAFVVSSLLFLLPATTESFSPFIADIHPPARRLLYFDPPPRGPPR